MSRPFPLVAVLVVLLAGCSSPAGPRPGGDAPGPGGVAQARFLAPMDLSGPEGGPEPVVVVAGDTVWVAAQDAAGGPPHVWYSSDGGRQFRESRPSGNGGGEVDIAVGDDVAFVTQLGPAGNVVSYTRDGGATWQQTTFAGANYFERELVAIDGAGSVYLVSRFGLRSLAGVQEDGATVARSDDGGVTFVPRGQVFDADHEPGRAIGNIAVAGDLVAVAYDCRDGVAVCFSGSRDRGVTWTQSLVAERDVDVGNVYPVLAASSGGLVVVWSDPTGGRLAVWGSASTDGGASWSAPARLSVATETATLPWVAASSGATWVAWMSTEADLADAGAAEAVDASWTVQAARVGHGLAVEERAQALPDPVHVGVMSKPIGRPGESGPYDRRFGDFLTVAVHADGRAVVATVDTTDAGARVLLATSR